LVKHILQNAIDKQGRVGPAHPRSTNKPALMSRVVAFFLLNLRMIMGSSVASTSQIRSIA
jgi:hypothetical protein